MREALVYLHGKRAGLLKELEYKKQYEFKYDDSYSGPPLSVTMPIGTSYHFDKFPPFFEGLLPEGDNLDELLRTKKIDRRDYFGQLLEIGNDTVGAATIYPVNDE